MSFELRKMSKATTRNIHQICDEIIQLTVELQCMTGPDAESFKQICNQGGETESIKSDHETVFAGLKGCENENNQSDSSTEFPGFQIAMCVPPNYRYRRDSDECDRMQKNLNLIKNPEPPITGEVMPVVHDIYRDTSAFGIDDLFKYESEETVLKIFNDRIDTDTKQYRDKSGRTVLHRAVENNFLSVTEQFLDYGVNPMTYDWSQNTPLHIAIDKGFDEMAALIVGRLPSFVVRRMFGDLESKASKLEAGAMKQNTSEKGKDNKYNDTELCNTYDKHNVGAMFQIKDLITKDLDKTLLQVLDSFIEEQPDGLYNVHVKLLDTDGDAREPNDNEFNFKDHTTFQTLTRFGKKDALNHPVVKECMEYKWKHWCQKRFLFYGCMYLLSLFCLTFSAVTGVTASDVNTYDTPLQHTRAVMEVISFLYALSVLFTEIRLSFRHKLQYFFQFFNCMELLSAILIVLVLPLRYTHLRAHWYVFALGYFLWAIRIFKYAIVFSQSGVYVEVIKQILAQDFVQFSILFLVINTIFSGTFLLVLKADDSLHTHIATSSFQDILYVGVRTLIEAGPIVDYTGTDGYRVAGTIIMLIYMFFTIVVMLNILIAQLSETYSRIHDESIKTVRANRAWIIAHAERNQWNLLPRKWSWTKYYKSEIENVEIKNIKKDSSILDDLSTTNEILRKKQIKIGLDVRTVKKKLQSLEKKMDTLIRRS